MTDSEQTGNDVPEEYCHTCGGYHTEKDYRYCPDRRWQEAYRAGYQEGYNAGVFHYVGSHFGGRTLPAA